MGFTRRGLPVLPAIVALAGCNYNHDLTVDGDIADDAAERTIAVTVLDYSPMPGQFVNIAPPYEAGADAVAMRYAAQSYLDRGYVVSLGSWGGSITLRLSEPVRHRPSGRDFRVTGNAFYNAASLSYPYFGNSEPGLILVSRDDNANGIADDRWYQIRGSRWDESVDRLTVRYYAPDENASDEFYIRWEASDGSEGYLTRNPYHTQPYFPQWINGGILEATGRRLPDNGRYDASLKQYVYDCFDYGYADAQPNNVEASVIDLSWAVDDNGDPADLTEIDFIRIYTGVLQSNGVLGETSTEVGGIQLPADEPNSRIAPVTGSSSR